MSVFDMQIALKHYHHVKIIVEQYRNNKVIIVGDFNLHDINWSPDDDENAFLPHTSNDHNANVSRTRYQIDALDFLVRMLSLPLSQLSNFQNNALNVLDLMFVNDSGAFNVTEDCHTISSMKFSKMLDTFRTIRYKNELRHQFEEETDCIGCRACLRHLQGTHH